MSSHTFWALVRHEFTLKGNRRKLNRSQTGLQWRVIYFALLAVIGIAAVLYFAVQGQLSLNRLWLVAIGFPYMLIAVGVAMVKREWDNETYGWWLSLPYSRLVLIGAKFIAAWLRVVVVSIGMYALISLLAGMIALVLEGYSATDVWSTLLTGLHVVIVVLGFGPIVLSFSFMAATLHYTKLRPVTPILWIVLVSGLSFFYNGIHVIFPQVSSVAGSLSESSIPLFPYPWIVLAGMGVSWIVAYLLIRLTASFLDRKLNL